MDFYECKLNLTWSCKWIICKRMTEHTCWSADVQLTHRIKFCMCDRVRFNRLWFVIHSLVFNFHDWILCYHEPFHGKIKKLKSLELSMDLWNFKVILTLWTLNYVDCVPFSCIDSFHIVHNWAN